MHIYEGGDSSTMREHLKQTNTEEQKKIMLDFSCWLCKAFTSALGSVQ